MKTIYKFPISVDAEFQTLDMHDGAEILRTVAESHGIICLWAMVDTAAPLTKRRIRVVGTGLSAEDLKTDQYIGSIQVLNGTYVFHIFDAGIIIQ